MRFLAAAVAAVAIAMLAVLALAGSNRFSGPILLQVGDRHGIHVTDVLVTVVGATAIGVVALLARRG